MNKFTVEKDWVSDSGYRCVVIMGSMGHRCGYVGIPSSHPLHGVDYSEEVPALEHKIEEVLKGTIGKRSPIIVLIMAGKQDNEFARPDFMFDVHGGLTYSGSMGMKPYPVPSEGLWWFGYDCGHVGDARDLATVEPKLREHYDQFTQDGVIRSLEYNITECESLAKQLRELEPRLLIEESKDD